MRNERGRGLDQFYAEALRHSLRRQILRLAFAHQRPISPSAASEALNWPLSNVSYHFRMLSDFKVLELESTAALRGSVEHFYAIENAALQNPLIEQCLIAGGPGQ